MFTTGTDVLVEALVLFSVAVPPCHDEEAADPACLLDSGCSTSPDCARRCDGTKRSDSIGLRFGVWRSILLLATDSGRNELISESFRP